MNSNDYDLGLPEDPGGPAEEAGDFASFWERMVDKYANQPLTQQEIDTTELYERAIRGEPGLIEIAPEKSE